MPQPVLEADPLLMYDIEACYEDAEEGEGASQAHAGTEVPKEVQLAKALEQVKAENGESTALR